MANQAHTHKVTGSCLHFLITQLGDTRSENPRGFYEFWVENLAEFSHEELLRGTKKFLLNWKRSTWPSLGEVRGSVLEARREIGAEKYRPQTLPQQKSKEPLSDEAIDQMIRGPLAELASRQGWILGLYDFVRDHHKLPTVKQQEKMVSDARYLTAFCLGMVNPDKIKPANMKLAKSLMERRKKLQERFGQSSDITSDEALRHDFDPTYYWFDGKKDPRFDYKGPMP